MFIYLSTAVLLLISTSATADEIECGNTYTLARGGSHQLDFYFPEEYPANHDCKFHVISSVEQTQLRIDFTHFDIEQHIDCNFDYLVVYDGITTRSSQIGKYCGSSLPGELSTSGQTATIVFHSDDSVGGRGFRLVISQTDPHCKTYTEQSGTLTTPRYPYVYPNNANCTYTIAPTSGSEIILTFTQFQMETSSMCQMDFLEISTKLQSYGRYCGSKSGISIIIPSSTVKLHFQSDRDSARKGFSIDYKVIGSCSDLADVCQSDCVADDNNLHTCTCPTGQKLQGFTTGCGDVNECETNNGGCEEGCRNTYGSFECSCTTKGHFLSPNGKNCTDRSCEVDNAGCEHSCHVTGSGGYYCTCNTGFLISSDGHNCSDINECKNVKYMHTCEQTCVNEAGSYYCECKEGYKLSSNGRSCDDIDECIVQQTTCSQQCRNFPGGWECSCYAGYEISPEDETYCIDIDECSPGLKPPHCLICTNYDGGHVCQCEKGFAPNGNETLCNDVNECLNNNGNCDQVCVNVDGSFHCTCNQGYELDATTGVCIDTNECGTNNNRGPCSHYCENLQGSFNCICPEGYHLQEATGTICIDDDECGKDNGNCEQSCVNTLGSFRCQCNIGYEMDKGKCVDSDECALKPCDQTVKSGCSNTLGSFLCTCPMGYFVNGTQCVDIDECSNTSLVKPNCEQACVNLPGSYECTCFKGYRYEKGTEGGHCVDIDECVEQKCQHSDLCTNLEGSFECHCPIGYFLLEDKISCSDIDECANQHDCEQNCLNKVGTYGCFCDSGYTLASDDRTCDDINECDSDGHGCSDGCLNLPGSYKCYCPTGHELLSNNKTCQDIDECANNNGGCDHVCRNTNGSYACSCLDGYSENTNTSRCDDINECATENGGCDQTCTNSNGTYACSCADNYKLGDDNKACGLCPTCSQFEAVLTDVATLKTQGQVIFELKQANKMMSARVEQLRDQVQQLTQRLDALSP